MGTRNLVILKGKVPEEPYMVVGREGVHQLYFRIETFYVTWDRNSKKQIALRELHSIAAWGDLAIELNKQTKMGCLIYVEGSKETHKWKDGNSFISSTIIRCKKGMVIRGGSNNR